MLLRMSIPNSITESIGLSMKLVQVIRNIHFTGYTINKVDVDKGFSYRTSTVDILMLTSGDSFTNPLWRDTKEVISVALLET